MTAPAEGTARRPRPAAWAPWAASGLAIAAIAAGALAAGAQRWSDVRASAVERMQADADQKAAHVASWRRERLADGRSISAHPLVARAAARLQARGFAGEDRGDLEGWARSRMQRPEYVGVAVVDPRGELLAGAGAPIDGAHRADVARSAAEGPLLLDLDGPPGARHADLVAPLFLPGPGPRRFVGAALLRIDPAVQLDPLLEAQGETGPVTRTVLVRTATGERLCASPLDCEAARAAALQAVRPVPGSPWSVAVVMEHRPLDAWMRARLGWIAVLAVALMAAVAVAAALWRRVQVATVQEHSRAAEGERVAHRLALEATGDGVWDWDVTTDALELSARFAALLGGAPRCSRMCEALAALHPDERSDLERRLAELVEGAREALALEHRIRGASGRWLWVLHRARAAARGSDGRALRVVGACTDVTERRQLQAQLLISDRLAALGTLAAGVTHEINNPLAYVVANVGFAREGLARLLRSSSMSSLVSRRPEEGGSVAAQVAGLRDALDEARDGAERVRHIVRDLRVLSRTDDETKPIDVARVLQASLAVARNEICRRARLRVDVAEVPPVKANEGRIGQVFLNLLVNAAQAVPEGHPGEHEVAVSTEVAGGSVRVRIRDTGCGIAPENLARIFDPFFTTKPAGVGTGLGLSICQRIVRDAGGAVQVASEPGRGSTFTVVLPQWRDGDEARPAATPVPLARSGRRGRILIVDDEPNVATAVARLLGAEHDVSVEPSGEAALERLLSGDRFDLVLCDLAMPGMSGAELFDEVRRRDPDAAARFAFMTGGAGTQEVEAFLARAGARLLEKPFTPEALRGVVGALVGA